jgi:hypothetical protein
VKRVWPHGKMHIPEHVAGSSLATLQNLDFLEALWHAWGQNASGYGNVWRTKRLGSGTRAVGCAVMWDFYETPEST